MAAYYNEIDPYCAEWLRTLILLDCIAPGDVDTRSIEDVTPGDLKGYNQCHFFAGIGVWSLALRNAGWRDDEHVWTGSCPCQPFSAAGKQKGTADARHLWPAWFRLIRECRPSVVFGEQVVQAIRHGWLDLVSTDLESLDYAVGAAVLGAHSVRAPHIRQRLYFVADSAGERRVGVNALLRAADDRRFGEEAGLEIAGGGESGELGNPDDEGSQGRRLLGASGGGNGASECAAREAGALDGLMADADGGQSCDGDVQRSGEHGLVAQDGGVDRRAGEGSFWSACDWLPCIDGKARPVEPGTFPLAHGVAARVGRLRAYGNAIVAPAAEAFIQAYREARGY
jgi:DNA (cytosine-5)-methyltransferase 1